MFSTSGIVWSLLARSTVYCGSFVATDIYVVLCAFCFALAKGIVGKRHKLATISAINSSCDVELKLCPQLAICWGLLCAAGPHTIRA